MLTAAEWQAVASAFTLHADEGGVGQAALRLYERITGFKETNPKALFHHQLSICGPPCLTCGKPLRTPQVQSVKDEVQSEPQFASRT